MMSMRCCAEDGPFEVILELPVAPERRDNFRKPSTAVMGVRISWLMLAGGASGLRHGHGGLGFTAMESDGVRQEHSHGHGLTTRPARSWTGARTAAIPGSLG